MKTHQIYGTLFTGITLVVNALADVAIVLLLIVNDVERAAGGAGA